MTTIKVDPEHPDPAVLNRAAAILQAGGLVAFPTETVYGLGAHALDPVAVQRVFRAKGRPSHNPLIAHVADRDGARRLVTRWPEAADHLADAFWPGPLTIILPRAGLVPAVVSAGLPAIAVRVPDHPVALALLRAANLPVVAPSANPSGTLSPTTADHVARHLGDRVQLILDAGPTGLGIESTVIDLTHTQPALLRPGALSAERIEAVVGPLYRPHTSSATPRHASPGLLDRHYAPRATLVTFAGDQADAAGRAVEHARRTGQTVGALLRQPLDAPIQHGIVMPDDAHAYARALYAALHRLDDLGCDLILVEEVPDGTEWEGIRDRLRRAATPATGPDG